MTTPVDSSSAAGNRTSVTTHIAVVIVNWNGARDTLACLDSLLGPIEQEKLSVVVVDNGSTDGSCGVITAWAQGRLSSLQVVDAPPQAAGSPVTQTPSRWPFMTLIRSPRNLGFAAGSNLGIRLCLESGLVDWIWLLNNDTAVEEGAVDALLACTAGPKAPGLIGCTIVEFSDRSRVQCAGGFRHRYLIGTGSPAYRGQPLAEVLASPSPRIDHIAGTSMLMRVDMLREVGLLNEEFFLYFEELDYALRAARAGYDSAWCRRSIVAHKGGVSAGSRSLANRRKTPLSEYHSNLSALKFTRRHRPGIFAIFFVARFALKLLHHIGSGNPRLIGPLTRAYRDYLGGR